MKLGDHVSVVREQQRQKALMHREQQKGYRYERQLQQHLRRGNFVMTTPRSESVPIDYEDDYPIESKFLRTTFLARNA
jgi:hypothetical protein